MNTPMNEMCEKCHYRIEAEKKRTPDLAQMLKLAMMVSKMFGQAGGAKTQPPPDTVRHHENGHTHHLPAAFAMDSLVEDKRIRIIKASLPYLDPTYQQLMHFLAKCLELKNIIDPKLYFDRAASKSDGNRSPLGMLAAVKPHLETEEQAAVSVACKALEMIEVFRLMDTITKGPDAADKKEPGKSDKDPPAFENII